MTKGQSCERFHFCVWGFAKDMIFRTFDSIYDGDEFIVVFTAVDTVVNNRKNFHRKSIRKIRLLRFNPLHRTVIHESSFGMFQKNYSAARCAGMDLVPEYPSSGVRPTIS